MGEKQFSDDYEGVSNIPLNVALNLLFLKLLYTGDCHGESLVFFSDNVDSSSFAHHQEFLLSEEETQL